MNEDEDIDTEEQGKNKDKRLEALKPYKYKKGKSGNPSGRPEGISLKEYARVKFRHMTDDEREEFFHGISKIELFKMAEGNPDTKSAVVITDDLKPIEDDIKTIKTVLGLGTETTDSAGS